MYKTLTTLIATNILLNFIIQAIIVERNLHSYYRLPTTTVKTSNTSEDYYILQCPFKSSMYIPKPKDMPVCLIVGRHSENEQIQKDLTKAKPRTVLNTQVDYRQLKPPPVPNLIKLVKIKNGKQYTMLLKPISKKENVIKKPVSVLNEAYKFFLKPPKPLINQTTVLYSVPLIQKIQPNDSEALSTSKETQKLAQIPKTSTTLLADNFDDLSDEEDTQPGPLKYLGVEDTLKRLQQTPTPFQQPPLPGNFSDFKSEKFFADVENHKKGYHSKGYQNMYHRDEIYQDHIFYDDLQQLGNYRVKEKLLQKKP